MHSYLSTIFGANSLNGFRGIAFYGRTITDNGRPGHSIRSPGTVKLTSQPMKCLILVHTGWLDHILGRPGLLGLSRGKY